MGACGCDNPKDKTQAVGWADGKTFTQALKTCRRIRDCINGIRDKKITPG